MPNSAREPYRSVEVVPRIVVKVHEPMVDPVGRYGGVLKVSSLTARKSVGPAVSRDNWDTVYYRCCVP